MNSAAWHVKSWQCGYIPAAVALSVVPVMCITGLYHLQSVFFEGLQSGEAISGTSFLQALNIMPWCNGIHTDSYSATAEDRMSCKLCLSRYDPTHSSDQFTVFTVFMSCYSFFVTCDCCQQSAMLMTHGLCLCLVAVIVRLQSGWDGDIQSVVLFGFMF